MMGEVKKIKDESSLTGSWQNKLVIIFWGLIIMGVAFSVGKGPVYLDIARGALLVIAAAIVARVNWPQKFSCIVFKVTAGLLTCVIIAAGLIGGSLEVVASGVLLFVVYFLGGLINKTERHSSAPKI